MHSCKRSCYGPCPGLRSHNDSASPWHDGRGSYGPQHMPHLSLLPVQAQSTMISILFSPKDGRTYQAKLPLFLDGKLAHPYFTVEVGSGLGIVQVPSCACQPCRFLY